MDFFVQPFSLKRPEGRNNFFIYFVSKILEKSLDLTIVELFFKELRAAVSVTVSEMNSTVGILLRTFWRKKKFFFSFQNWPKKLFIYVWLLKETFFVRSVPITHQWMVTSKKRSIWYVSAFINILSISIQQLFFRHERCRQEYFHISCGTILRKLNKTPWKILCLPSDHLQRMAPGICNIMGSEV